MKKNWLVIAAAEHVALGLSGGFVQVCHGKHPPLRRLKPGDRLVCYSPTRCYSASHAARAKDRLQAFTAIGTVQDRAPYQADMGAGFHPYRRDVAWHDAEPTPIAELQGVLAITQEKNWGYRLRQGLVELSDADMTTIAEAMFRAWSTSVRPFERQPQVILPFTTGVAVPYRQAA
jgi:hypothetical protein